MLILFYVIAWLQVDTLKTTTTPARVSKVMEMPVPIDPEIGPSVDGECVGDTVGDSVGYKLNLVKIVDRTAASGSNS